MIRRKLFKKSRMMVAIISASAIMVGCASQESTPVAATATVQTTSTLLETESAIEAQSEVIPEEDGEAPVLTVTNTHIEVIEGTAVDVMSGVSASDEKDGDLTGNIGVSAYDASSLDVEQTITYTVADEAGNETAATAVVLIKSNPIEVLDKTMYSTSSVNVRATSNQDGEKLGSLAFAQEIHVTGRDKTTGWYQIDYNGGVSYVSNTYLSDTKPAPKPVPAKPSSIGSGVGSSTPQPQSTPPAPSSDNGGNPDLPPLQFGEIPTDMAGKVSPDREHLPGLWD